MTNTLGFYRGKRVLVTGHTGFKGAWMSQWLLELGAKVSGFSDCIPTQPSLFEALGLSTRLEHNLGDVGELEHLDRVVAKFDPEVVFHMAAQPLVRRSYDQPILTFQTNVMGTAHVMESLRSVPSLKSAVFITTDKVYESHDSMIGYREGDRLGGHDPYSGSKAACELVIQSYWRSFFAVKKKSVGIGVTRAGNVIGGGDWSEDRLIPDVVRAWQSKKPLVIRSPESVRPWQHVLEPLGGYLHYGAILAQQPEKFSGEAFNFGPITETGGTVREITALLAKKWKGLEVKIDTAGTEGKKEAALLRLDCSKAERELDWHPRIHLGDALEWTASWYEDFYRNPADAKKITLEQIRRFTELQEQRSV